MRENPRRLILGGSAGEPPKPWELDHIYEEDAKKYQGRTSESFLKRAAAGEFSTPESRMRSARFEAMLRAHTIRHGKFKSEWAAMGEDANQPEDQTCR